MRCSFTKGRCWQCTNPALPKRAFCRLHLHSENDFELPGPEADNFNSTSHPEEKSSKRKRRRRKKQENTENEVAGAEEEGKVIRKELPFGVLIIPAASSSTKLKNSAKNSGGSTKRTEDRREQSKIRARKNKVMGSSAKKRPSCKFDSPNASGDGCEPIRCCFTKGRCWRCTNPTLPKRAFCRLHSDPNNDSKLPCLEPDNYNQVPDLKEKSVEKKRGKRKKKEENTENEVAGREVGGKGIRKELPFEALTISAAASSNILNNPVMNSSDLTKRTEDGGEQIEIPSEIIKVKGSSTKQVNSEKSYETSIPTAGNNTTAAEVNGTEVVGFSAKLVDFKRQSCKTNIPTVTRDIVTAAEDKGIEDNSKNQNKTVVEKSCYDLRQLRSILKQFSLKQAHELEIEAHIQGKGISEVQISVIMCNNDGKFKCDSCQTKIENFHRSCIRCNYNLCIECCQVIRGQHLTEEDETVNCRQPIIQKAIESIYIKLFCPNNPCGICGEDTVKMKCIVHVD